MINTWIEINDRPCAFRYPRGNGLGIDLASINEKIAIGKGRIIQEGSHDSLKNQPGTYSDLWKVQIGVNNNI